MSIDRLHPAARRLLTLGVLAVFATLAAATSSAPDETEPADEAPSSGALQALEAHLQSGGDYGEGPDGALLAQVVREALAPGDAVAVRVVPGAPRRVVVLVRYRADGGYENLRDIPSRERNEELDRILEAIDGGYEAGADELAVAIRGTVFYGAIAIRRPGQAVEYHSGSVVSTRVLDPLLDAAPAPEALASVAIGTPVQGQLAPAPMPQPTYTLTLTEARTIRVRLTTDQRGDDLPIALVCNGARRAASCGDEDMPAPLEDVPESIWDEQEREENAAATRGRSFSEEVYRLEPGTYTVAVFRAECESCPASRARYTLTVL